MSIASEDPLQVERIQTSYRWNEIDETEQIHSWWDFSKLITITLVMLACGYMWFHSTPELGYV